MGSSVTNVVVTSPGGACDQECWVHVSLVSRSTVSQTLRLTLACKYWMGQTCQTTTGINRKYCQNTISQRNKHLLDGSDFSVEWMCQTTNSIHSGINTPFRRNNLKLFHQNPRGFLFVFSNGLHLPALAAGHDSSLIETIQCLMFTFSDRTHTVHVLTCSNMF